MTVLAIGGGGYIGCILAEELLARGHRVVVYDRFYFGEHLLDPLRSDRLELVRGDARTIDKTAFQGIDTVIHLAALSNDPTCDLDPILTEDINRSGTLRSARLAKEAGVPRFIFSSSCSVYGQGATEELTEDSPRHPVSLYAKLKAEVETALNDMATDRFVVSSLRNATVYGLSPRMRFDLVVNIMTLHAFKNQKIFILGGGQQWRPLVHVRDVCRAFMLVMDAPAAAIQRQAFNIGSDAQNYRVRTIANMIARIIPGTQIEMVPDDPDKRTYKPSFQKAKDVLGFEPVHDVEPAVEEIHQALRDGRVEDTIRTKTLAFYKYLREAEQLVKELSIDGKLL
jgi:nucleoside-diphosphate-sugar epimerase